MKIAVIGPGAMGCLFAGFLSKSKEEIWLLDRNVDRARKIKEKGISVEGVSGSWRARVNATCQAQEIGAADLILVTVKAYETKEALKNIQPLLKDETLVLTLQNGLGNIEVISELAGQERVLGGVTSQGATLLDAASIRHAGVGDTIIGRADGKIPVQLRAIRELFNKSGIETRLSRDIRALIWSKLIINVGINALTAVTRLHNGRIIEFQAAREILEAAVSEALKVAKKKRVKIIYDDPLSKVEAVCQATAANVSSMLQDVLRRKETEIDFINGAIVRQGQGMGIPTPVNSVLTSLVKTIESSYKVQIAGV